MRIGKQMTENDNVTVSLDLFKDLPSGLSVYAVLDAARNPDIAVKPCEFQANWVSLYKGEPEQVIRFSLSGETLKEKLT